MAILDARGLAAPQRLLLDSAVWIAATTSVADVIPSELLLILEQAAHDERLLVSAATVWELALLARRGDIDFGDFPLWVADQMRPPGVMMLPITHELMYQSTVLPGWVSPSSTPNPKGGANGHSRLEPSAHALLSSEAIDRFLVTSAMQTGAVVVTTDLAILAYAESGAVNAYDARA